MKKNIIYGSIFLVITIAGLILAYVIYQKKYVHFDSTKITVSMSNELWTNQDITLTAQYDGNIRVQSYSFDGGVTWQNSNSYTVTDNGKLEVVLKTPYGRKSVKVPYVVENIDKELPIIVVDDIIYTAKGSEFNFSDYYDVFDKISGIKEIKVMNDDDIDIHTIGQYPVEIEVIDRAGNTSSATVIVSVVSKNDPNLSSAKKEKIDVIGLSVDKTKVSLVKGSKVKITAMIKPSNATNKKITWNSVNTGVAKVNSKGEITAIAAGSTTVLATTEDGAKVSEVSVIVTDRMIEVESIQFDRKSDIVNTNSDTIILTAIVKPETATTQNLTWRSSTPSVATVKDGKITVKGEGNTTITATSSNGKIAAYELTVKDNYVFQEIKMVNGKDIVGYNLKIYKNGIDITESITKVTSPFIVTHNQNRQLELTIKQHEMLGDSLTVIYESTNRDVQRG